jgi:hypothetical protein
MMISWTQSIALGLVALATTVTAHGGARAGDTWLCSVASVVAVDEDGTIGPPDFGDKERPTFFRLDATKKELTLLAPESRRGEVTKLEAVLQSEDGSIFTGVENNRGVTLIISPEGRLTLSIIADGAVWSAFGHALPERDAK